MTEQEHMRRCLIRQLLRWRHERGLDWSRGYVDGWRQWDALRSDFATQWRLGNRGAKDDWRE